MKIIELNHWYVDENNLSISLARFYVMIQTLALENSTYYQLIISNGEEKAIFRFQTLEEAISFTENVVANSPNLQDICVNYSKEKQLIKTKRR